MKGTEVFVEKVGRLLSCLQFSRNIKKKAQSHETLRSRDVIINDHIVLGDSTTEIGITAPFDEEHTSEIFKIEPFNNTETNILKFWFDNNNKDLYTSKTITRPKFNRS